MRQSKLNQIYVEEVVVARIALRLADAVEASGKTTGELAKELKVSKASIDKILSADGNPTVKMIARIAAALGREFDPLFGSVSFELNQLTKDKPS